MIAERVEIKTNVPKEIRRELKHSLLNKFKLLFLVLRYTFLIGILILLASHEKANPKIGNTHIEFYSAQFSELLAFMVFQEQSDEAGLVKDFYNARQNLPAWTTNFQTNESFDKLVDLLAAAPYYGLLPGNYNYSEILACKQTMLDVTAEEDQLKARVCLEYSATEAIFKFMKHIALGINITDTSAYVTNFYQSLPLTLSFYLSNSALQEGILELQPKSRQYQQLQNALAKYLHRALDDTSNYTKTELESNFELISNRLISQGYLDDSFQYDSVATYTAIRNFQQAHKLKVTGQIDDKTAEWLSIGTKERFYRIALNLDRIRKDRIRNQNEILVNIPEFQLYYYDKIGNENVFTVVVGKKSSQTPLITDEVETIVANPYWTVPKKIARNELLPLIKKDTLYLQKHGFIMVDDNNNEVDPAIVDWENIKPYEFDYWLRQTKVNNALGVIKFLFPNEHAVYLHDTQSKRLFNQSVRAYSHGCVRVKDPEKLAELIVANNTNQGSSINIKKIIRARDHKEIRITDPLPIQIRYYTCTADSSGNVIYHPDVYAKDDQAIQELFGNSSWN